MKKKSLLSLLFVCSMTLAACGGSSDKTADSGAATSKEGDLKEYRVCVLQEMPSADLSIATDTISFAALNNVYEGLYRLNPESKVEAAGAAEMAEVSEDGLVYKIKLRDDAKWSNGDNVTAADYVYGWQRTVDPATGSQYAYLYENVANAKAIMADEAAADTLGIKAVGDYELEITLDTATPYFDYLLAFPSFFPQHQATVEEYGTDFAQTSENAVYNGPYVLADFDGPGVDTEWSYLKNDKYWDAKTVQMDKISVSVVKESATGLSLFQNDQADEVVLTGELAQQNANDPEFVVVKNSRTSYIEMNQREADSEFNNENLRKALSYAIDREALVTNVLGDGCVASKTLVPEGMSFNPETGDDFIEDSNTAMEYDLEKAQEYWEKAKKELGITEFSFELLADDQDSTKRVGEYIQGAWSEAFDGMTVKLITVPFTVRLDRSDSGDFDVVIGGWGADYSDPSSFTDLFTTGNSYNRGHWENPEYDALVKSAATTNATNPEARWQDLLEAEELISAQAGAIPVYQKAEGHLRSEKIKGVVANGAGAPYEYKWVYIEE
ncbi:oligopeptide transport system substrate-binding protein [Enterococcus sp. PF1-24]|uniref:peptide ABC transporter substrate-binding protein n=1 Tax=unclassified Enterococcus TaxID=2608891 RepID=UPI0024743093|nr:MULTISPECIES: peptide ABC transporter substrate-binding protein [unclassified Enterococcus]MDH6363547.1 oligopeptide transport system substrate-binding protein [Enterococcus sp. PFB1-1]MDH6400782.1 oligopeptide transport system substrate-binding protein [Enterococcus sp. PF1-24]